MTTQDDSAFHVSRSLRAFSAICHSSPRFWTAVANLESAVLEDSLARIVIDRPIYITGLARSGTTALLETLASLPGIATHRYIDFPPVLTPYLWNRYLELVPKPSQVARERAHGDGMLVTPESPEAMEEVVWMRFFGDAHDPRRSNLLDASTIHPTFESFYRNHIRKLLLVRRGTRYLAKGNYNVGRIGYIRKLFPDARFVVPLRHPVTHIASLIRQHERFARGQRRHPESRQHLRRVGHYEFGLDRVPINMGDQDTIDRILGFWADGQEVAGWALYWAHVYGSLREQIAQSPELQTAVHFVRYEDLCVEPAKHLSAVFEHCGAMPSAGDLERLAAVYGKREYYRQPFTAEDLETIRTFTSAVADSYGYAPDHE